MSNEKKSFLEPKNAPQQKTCFVCDGQESTANEQVIPYEKYVDGSGRQMWIHPRHLTEQVGMLSALNIPEGMGVSRPNNINPELVLTASAEDSENIWEFAEKFRYFGSSNKNAPTPPEGSMVQETFPITNVIKPSADMRSDVESAYNKDGEPR
jgi:hypothetical protein